MEEGLSPSSSSLLATPSPLPLPLFSLLPFPTFVFLLPSPLLSLPSPPWWHPADFCAPPCRSPEFNPNSQGAAVCTAVFAKRFGILLSISDISGELCRGRALSFCVTSHVYPRVLPSLSLIHHPEAPPRACPHLTGKPDSLDTQQRPVGDTCHFPGGGTGAQKAFVYVVWQPNDGGWPSIPNGWGRQRGWVAFVEGDEIKIIPHQSKGSPMETGPLAAGAWLPFLPSPSHSKEMNLLCAMISSIHTAILQTGIVISILQMKRLRPIKMICPEIRV